MSEAESELERVLLELGAARERVELLERRLRELRASRTSTGSINAADSKNGSSVPPRLQSTLSALESFGGTATLDDIYKAVKRGERDISRAGVRARILKLADLGQLTQVHRGLFRLIKR